MRENNKMTSKDIHIAVKRSDGIRYLMDRFSIQTEEALFEAIRKVSPLGAEEFIKTLKKKQKKVLRALANSAHKIKPASPVFVLVDPVTIIPEEEATTEEVAAAESVVAEEIKDVRKEGNSQMDILEKLRAEEQDLSEMLCTLEGEHKAYGAMRRKLNDEVSEFYQVCEDFKRKAQEYYTRGKELIEKFDDCKVQMELLNIEKADYSKRLAEVRDEIANLTKVTIYVYETGIIEVENAQMQDLPEDKLNDEFAKLVCMPQADELKIKQLRGLAKLRLLLGEYKDATLIFDSPSVQAFYEEVVA